MADSVCQEIAQQPDKEQFVATFSLKDIVDQQPDIQPKQHYSEIDWNARREAWIKQVEKLIDSIINFIEPFKGSKLDYKKEYESLDEHLIGSYEALSLKLFIGTNTILIRPRGTLIIGGMGRVDMDGPKGGVMFILSRNDKLPSISVKISVGDPPYEDSDESQQNDKLLTAAKVSRAKWHIVYSKYENSMTLFNESSFTQALQAIM
ncbi:MAG: hypothetical protein HQL95_03085 [Magnetococcales bacterium]|nr:hypothetical protein [Magnetococcales bacterium]